MDTANELNRKISRQRHCGELWPVQWEIITAISSILKKLSSWQSNTVWHYHIAWSWAIGKHIIFFSLSGNYQQRNWRLRVCRVIISCITRLGNHRHEVTLIMLLWQGITKESLCRFLFFPWLVCQLKAHFWFKHITSSIWKKAKPIHRLKLRNRL